MHIKKIYSCYLLLLAPLSLLFAQQVVPSNENYTMRVSAKEPLKTVAEFEQAAIDQKAISITYFDGLGRPKQQVAVGVSPDMAPTTNQLTMDWSEGSGGTPFFEQKGQTSENQILWGTDPTGANSLLWQCGNDAASDADGGWNAQYIEIDNTKTYRYAVWVKRTGSQDGKTYHGTRNVTYLSGDANSNPYFWEGDLPQLNTWYLMVGIIHPHNYTGEDQGISGVYDTNGTRILDGKEFKWISTATTSSFRSYLFYSTDTSVRQYFWNPTVHIVDGAAHKQEELTTQETIYNADIVAHIEYDHFGRQAKQYLPITSKGAAGSYQEVDVVEDINAYYLNKYPDDFAGITDPTQVNAYAEQIYDRSPVGRVTEQSAPGSVWKYKEGSIQYEDPVYTYFPTTLSYDQFWEAQDLFYIPGENNLPSAYNDEGMLMLNNLARLIIEDGILTLRIRTITEDESGHPLPLGKIRHLPIASPIASIDLGILTDANGNNTDYRIGIEDNYLTITATTATPANIPGGLFVDITYDLTQIEYVTYQNIYYDTPDSHTVKSAQDLNTTTEVARFDVVVATDGTPTLVQNGRYEAQQLSKSIIKNENWVKADGHANTAESFTDKTGKVLMTRSYVETATNTLETADTYNIYDDFGNLTFVIPPAVVISDGISDTELNELMYQYQYDQRNRLIRSKNPGKGWDQIVYNELDQPVLTQNAVLAAEAAWLFVKYDVLGRVVYTGRYNNTRSRRQLQDVVDQMSTYHEERATAAVIDGTDIYYTNTIFPTTDIALHTISYYDDYNFDIVGLTNPGSVYGESITQNTKLLATGSKVRVLGTDDWITSVPYYDKKARGIYAASKNEYLSTTDIIETQLDFTSKVIQSTSIHTKGNNEPIVMIDNFTYDAQGRVLTQTQQINDQQEELLASYVYDEMGQATTKKVGGNVTTSGSAAVSSLQTIDYAFNIRGWLQSINEGKTDNGDLFGYAVHYTTTTENLGATPLYNGNISEISWQTANDHTKRAYGYQYDTTDRLTKAISSEGNYDLSEVTYDKMGNILSLERQGHTNADATAFGVMDDLTYTYGAGHKLQSVSDAGDTTFGFADGNTAGTDYTYNTSGSLIEDRNKGITSITYNHFELPTQITFEQSATKKIEYVYTATGSKIKKILTNGSDITETEYAGGAQYKNGALQFIPTAEGYIEPDQEGFTYIYQYTDHLGNTRLAYSDKDNSGTISADEIIEENNYYPFGLSHRGYNNAINGRSHTYKYNNTELEEGLGLDW
ncbi:DUF6443 domain-containing protein, partial [Aquimarina pacifica]|uniref:DUF6443 domain-containing protein n=1 Tax=Aquimarina pacifica TaxID=1296415 RepID=UPI001F4D2088